jgi:hypothetical protein
VICFHQVPRGSTREIDKAPDGIASILQSLGPFFLGTLLTAAFGAFAGAWASTRRETKRAVIAELNSIAAARMLSFSICNKYLALKKQHILPLRNEYESARQRYLEAREAFAKGDRTRVVELRADLKTITKIWLPTQSLERQVFEKISIRGRALAAAVDLIACIESVDKTIINRDHLVSEIQQAGQRLTPEKYFGVPTAEGVIDERMKSNVEGLYALVDDCIFFSRKLADDLFSYGTALRRRHAWKFRLGVPKLERENWEFARKEGLLPDDAQYADWLRGFPPKSPSTRLGKRLGGIWQKKAVTNNASKSPDRSGQATHEFESARS